MVCHVYASEANGYETASESVIQISGIITGDSTEITDSLTVTIGCIDEKALTKRIVPSDFVPSSVDPNIRLWWVEFRKSEITDPRRDLYWECRCFQIIRVKMKGWRHYSPGESRVPVCQNEQDLLLNCEPPTTTPTPPTTTQGPVTTTTTQRPVTTTTTQRPIVTTTTQRPVTTTTTRRPITTTTKRPSDDDGCKKCCECCPLCVILGLLLALAIAGYIIAVAYCGVTNIEEVLSLLNAWQAVAAGGAIAGGIGITAAMLAYRDRCNACNLGKYIFVGVGLAALVLVVASLTGATPPCIWAAAALGAGFVLAATYEVTHC